MQFLVFIFFFDFFYIFFYILVLYTTFHTFPPESAGEQVCVCWTETVTAV